MKRTVVTAIVSAVLAIALWGAAESLAGQPAKPAAKKNATGTIELVSPKQHTIKVKPVAANQQVQVQSSTQKPKGQQPESLVLVVDDKTQILPAAVPQKGVTPQKGAVPQKGAAPQAQDQFGRLAVGQLVRVVYEECATTTQTQGTQASAQKTPGQAVPVKKAPVKQPLPFHAVTIEILTVSVQK